MSATRLPKYEDLYDIKMVSDPQIDPQGNWVVFTVTEVDKESDGYRSSLWLVPTRGGEPRRLTHVGKVNMQPRWSPQGDKLAFISDRGGGNQVWVLPFSEGGEAYPVTADLRGISSPPVWRPDGKALAVVALGPAQPGEDLPERSEIKTSDRLLHKFDGTGVFGPGRQQVYVVPSSGGKATQVTWGDCDHGVPAWSPDGRRLALAVRRSADADHTALSDLYLLDVGSGEYQLLRTNFSRFLLPSPVWSPDGSRLLMVAAEGRSWGNRTPEIWLVEVESGHAESLTREFDRPPAPVDSGDIVTVDARPLPQWSPHGDRVFTLFAERGQCELYSLDLRTRDIERLSKGHRRVLTAFSMARDGSFAYTVTDPSRPNEVYYLSPTGEEKRLTDFNGFYFGEMALRPVELVTYQGPDGLPLEGWLITPGGQGPHPLILSIHGGPHGAYGFAYHHGFQCLAAQGYAVLYTNPRGSQSYGTAFAQGCVRDWGGKDFGDLMAGVDEAVRRGVADPDRLGVSGYSYGGFMTNWIITHSARFKAAVSGGCLSNLLSFYGSSDLGYLFLLDEIGGPPWETVEALLQHSPLMHVANVTTPVLFLHGEADDRCPIEQAEQIYVALRQLGKQAQLVRYPQSSHLFILTGKPSFRIDYWRRLTEWFDRYLKDRSS
ncbi:MAG: S9 family peptidase [Bacillota bacterium]